MPNPTKHNPTVKKLHYLLHKQATSQQSITKIQPLSKNGENQIDKSLNKNTILPMILQNNHHKNISTQHQNNHPIATTPNKRQNQYRQTVNNQISAKEYIEVNKSILKMIEQKIYPMNKQLTKKMKLKHNNSCQSVRSSHKGAKDDSLIEIKKPKNQNKNKNKKRQLKQIPKAGDISDDKLGLTNREKRTKSQEQIIRLQAKVESYLRDSKRILKYKFDEQMQNIVYSSLKSSKVTQSIKQQAKQRTIKRLLTIHSIKKKKSRKDKTSLNNSFNNQKRSELKRVIKLFEERGNNHTSLETGREENTRFQILDQTEKIENLKEFTGVSTKDLSQSLKVISNMVNRKLEPVIAIKDADVKDTGHRQIIRRVEIQESNKMAQSDNNNRSRAKILLSSKQNSKLKQQHIPQNKPQQSRKKLTYSQHIEKQAQPQNEKLQQGVKLTSERSLERRQTDKLMTKRSSKSRKSSKQKEKQNIGPFGEQAGQKRPSEFDLKSQKSYKIISSRQGHVLEKELIGQIQQELLDEKKNLLKRKINEKKLMKRRKDSYIVGIGIL